MKNFILFFLLFVVFATFPTICVIRSINFSQNCSGYLKQAADANTIDLALERVNLALDYIEKHQLTDGYTSVLWKTEDENIGYWYRNIKACQHELEEAIGGTQLEKANVLMKVRETLTDNGESGTKLTIPDGISRYPYNLLFGILNLISTFVFSFCIIFGLLKLSD